MKITKLAHSCLLVETPEAEGRVVLFDPGKMSVELVKQAHLQRLDDIIITHEHYDHFNLELVVALAAQFPHLHILAPEPVVAQLAAAGVTTASPKPSEGEGLELFESPHEPMTPLGDPPAAIGAHYANVLTHPGDSHHFASTKEVLALPITAPWGTSAHAAQLIAELRPRYVIPIHDWMWKDSWRDMMYAQFAEYCKTLGIEFISPVDGVAFTLNTSLEG
jgi:L-ascorbate metabolism protein UlaG (beta-lactamase superfamily)